jgi:hypothetical protein
MQRSNLGRKCELANLPLFAQRNAKSLRYATARIGAEQYEAVAISRRSR